MNYEPRIVWIGIYSCDGGERITNARIGPTLDSDDELIARTVNTGQLEPGDYIAAVSTPGTVPRLLHFTARVPAAPLEVVL